MTECKPLGVSEEVLARLFALTPSGVHRAILKGTFPIATYGRGKRRFADPRIVDAYFAARTAEQLAAFHAMSSLNPKALTLASGAR